MTRRSNMRHRCSVGGRTNRPRFACDEDDSNSVPPVKSRRPSSTLQGQKKISDEAIPSPKHELKFARRKKGNKPVLSKWSGGKRATWGENKKGGSPYSYEKGDVFLSSHSEWRYLYKQYEEHGLPLDPDPITTITFVDEFLLELFTRRYKKNEVLRRRIKYTLGGDVTEDFITAPFRKAVREWGFKFFFTDRFKDVMSIINNALANSKSEADFQTQLAAEFNKSLTSAIKSNIKTALKTLAL